MGYRRLARDPAIFGGVDLLVYGFLDTTLHEDVLNAYHAVAIDERRIEFPATLWSSPPKPGQMIEQVYFCGVHSDVGGGYPTQTGDSEGLSDITLSWMMNKAAALGLILDPDAQKLYPLPLDPKFALDILHESWSVLWGFPKRRSIAPNATIADSVLIRCQHHDGWQPKNLELQNGLPAAHYAVARVVQPAAVAVA